MHYLWYNVAEQCEAWDRSRKDLFVNSEVVSWETLCSTLQTSSTVTFLKLLAYNKNDAIKDIHTYDEFKNSSCRLLVLLYDCSFVEVYSKSEDHINKIFNTAVNMKCKNIIFISDEKFFRTKMNVV